MKRCRWRMSVHGLICTVMLAACGDAPGSTTKIQASDSAGIAIVRNSRPRPDTAVAARAVMRIGIQNGADEYQFSQIRHMAAGPDGELYVVDVGAQRVTVYDTAGRHVRTIGRAGQGPGEFGAPQRIWSHDSGVVVLDTRGGVFTFFDRDGRVTSTVRDRGDSTHVFLVGPTARGWAGEIRNLSYGAGDSQWRVPDRRMSILDLENRAAIGPMYELPPDTMKRRSGFFARPTRVVVGRNNVYEATQTRPYRLRVYDLHGRLQRIIERDYKPIRPQPEWYDDAKARMEARTPMGSAGDWERDLAQAVAQLEDLRGAEEDEHVSPVERILPSDDGTVWVERLDMVGDHAFKILQYSGRQGIFPRPYASTWDVFDSTGALQATVALPEGFEPMLAQGMSMLGAQWDADDVQYVVRYAVDLKQN